MVDFLHDLFDDSSDTTDYSVADEIKYCIDNDIRFNKSTKTQDYKVDGKNFDLEIAGKTLSEVLLTLEAKHPDFSASCKIDDKSLVDYIKETKPEIAKQQEEHIALIKEQVNIAKEIAADYNKRHGLEKDSNKQTSSNLGSFFKKNDKIEKEKASKLAAAITELENSKDKDAMHKAIDQFKAAASENVGLITVRTTRSAKQAEEKLR